MDQRGLGGDLIKTRAGQGPLSSDMIALNAGSWEVGVRQVLVTGNSPISKDLSGHAFSGLLRERYVRPLRDHLHDHSLQI